ncbi:hypothetical protein SRHO_G00233610 [Serrasalmus rhombeus]
MKQAVSKASEYMRTHAVTAVKRVPAHAKRKKREAQSEVRPGKTPSKSVGGVFFLRMTVAASAVYSASQVDSATVGPVSITVGVFSRFLMVAFPVTQLLVNCPFQISQHVFCSCPLFFCWISELLRQPADYKTEIRSCASGKVDEASCCFSGPFYTTYHICINRIAQFLLTW